MKIRIFVFALLAIFACSCQKNVCPPESVSHLPEAEILLTRPSLSATSPNQAPSQVKVGGKMITVDQIVSGPLCNGAWKGTVYIGCDVQVAEWKDEKQPAFLEKCDLTIEPGTVVYVAAHNDAAYYNGCSCHTRSDLLVSPLYPYP